MNFPKDNSQADAPDASKIPKDDMIGASVLLLEIKYNEQVQFL